MKPNIAIVTALWIVVIVLFVSGLAMKCSAQSDDKTALVLAQCLVAECDRCDRGEEKAAIAWVLWKGMKRYNANPRNKSKRTFLIQIREYCTLWDRDSKYYKRNRTRTIRASTQYESGHLKTKHWSELLAFAMRFVVNPKQYRDPHPNSVAFGGMMDIEQALKKGLKPIGQYCNKDGEKCTIIFG